MAKIAIVGAGHNGLVAAFYLARAGHSVDVLEASHEVGGACRARTYDCGCVSPLGATHYGMLLPEIRRDTKLHDRGLQLRVPEPQFVALTSRNSSIGYYTSWERTRDELARFSRTDGEGYARFVNDLTLARDALRSAFTQSTATLAAFAQALEERRAGLSSLFIFNSLKGTLDHYFSSDEAKELFLAAAVLYRVSPRRAGTAIALPYLAQAAADDETQAGWAFVIGGMSRVALLLADSAAEQGAKIHLHAAVASVDLRPDGACRGVLLKSGEKVPCDYLLIAADPLTAASIVGGATFDVVSRLRRNGEFVGSAGRLNILARRPIRFSVDDHISRTLNSTLVVANCSFPAFDAAYEQVMAGRPAATPYLELFCPTEIDPATGCGRHSVTSAYLLHLPYVAGGRESTVFDGYEDHLREYLDSLDSGFSSSIEKFDLLTPRDLERELGLPLGHPDHGNMDLARLFERRPAWEMREGRTHIENVMLCSAGGHPGGLVTGAPGFNAAKDVLRRIASKISSAGLNSASRVRQATSRDLPEVVALEHVLFADAPFLFDITAARRLYALCPEAFIVAESHCRVIAYAVVFPLSPSGVQVVEALNVASIIVLPSECLNSSLDETAAATYVEVIAAAPEATVATRASLLRRILGIVRGLQRPAFTFPYTTEGRTLAERLGFHPITIDGSEIGSLMRLDA